MNYKLLQSVLESLNNCIVSLTLHAALLVHAVCVNIQFSLVNTAHGALTYTPHPAVNQLHRTWKTPSHNSLYADTRRPHNALDRALRSWHSSGVNDRRPLVWSPLGHWSGCVFHATWGMECAGSPIVSVCLRVSLSGHIPSVCVKERPIKWEWARVSHTEAVWRLWYSWGQLIMWSGLTWKQKWRHTEELTLNVTTTF